MNLPDLRAQMEAELLWRQDELRFFQNRLSGLDSDRERDQYRRALVLLLYAHFEGFCKFCFSLYVDAINAENITCGDANYAIAAAAMAAIFRELRDPAKKCGEFRRDLPDDTVIHRFARDRDFLEQSDMFGQKPVRIPDFVVDTESNLTPVVLRKNLYRLGFAHTQFEQFERGINRLLTTRNRIAHGESGAGVEARDYAELHEIVFRIMNEITAEITLALDQRTFLRIAITPQNPVAGPVIASQ